jgi:hypothetical protein
LFALIEIALQFASRGSLNRRAWCGTREARNFKTGNNPQSPRAGG